MSEKKYCEQCVSCFYSDGRKVHVCDDDRVESAISLDLLTTCIEARALGGDCGPAGKYWEAKP
jgi:hypothetical protein